MYPDRVKFYMKCGEFFGWFFLGLDEIYAVYTKFFTDLTLTHPWNGELFPPHRPSLPPPKSYLYVQALFALDRRNKTSTTLDHSRMSRIDTFSVRDSNDR